MFSMKYTSPKVTPKKGIPSSGASALDPAATSSLADGNSNTYDGDWGVERREPRSLPNSFTGKESTRHAKLPKINESLAKSSLTKDHLTCSNSNHNSTASVDISENDSAVANVSEDVGPRSNLLALLDKDYLHGKDGDSTGNGSARGKEMLQCNEKSNPDVVDLIAEKDCIHGDAKQATDEQPEADIKCGDNNFGYDNMTNLQSISPANLSDGISLSKSKEDIAEFHRSVSMEPSFDNDLPERASPPTLTTFPLDSKEGELTDGKSNSLGSPSDRSAVGPNGSNAKSTMPEKATNASSPTIYDVTEAQLPSPLRSDINGDRLGDELTTPVNYYSPRHSEVNTSEIGGDTYFDQPHMPCLDPGKKPRSDFSFEDDIVHVTLPPRVNRTTSNGYASKDRAAPFLPHCPSTPVQLGPGATPFSPTQSHHHAGILSPRPAFSHTHSLLDDCSDEEEEITMFSIVDSPTRHVHYSCLPRPRSNSEGSSPFASYFKKNKQKQSKHIRHNSRESAGSTAMQVASNNIQQALLQTKHRRWDCQSAYAGAHAQSKEIFDISNRVHYVPGYRPNNGYGSQLAARLSVSVEAIRAALLASGIWRTLRLVRLPKGLFSTHQMDRHVKNGEVWELLKMLNSTLPMLDQIDFGGYFIRASKGPDDIASISDDWRDDMLSSVMECLPNLVAIDGFVVEKEVFETESHNNQKALSTAEKDKHQPANATHRNRKPRDLHMKASANKADDDTSDCGECGDNCETVSMCGFSDFVDRQSETSQENATICAAKGVRDSQPISGMPNSKAAMSRDLEESPVFFKPEKFESAKGISFEANECCPVEKRISSLYAVQLGHETIEESSSHESTDDGLKKVPTLSPSSSMLSSSRSWGSNSSGTRPPTCPQSASRPRLPTKPVDRKKGKGSFMKAGSGLKRRVLSLIPTVSMMDGVEDDEEDEDSEDSEDAVETDCPADLL